jgi:hypothetical protein
MRVEANMSHRQNTNSQLGMSWDEDACEASAAATEWDADTDVMPPEYCRQLLKISRQLEQTE